MLKTLELRDRAQTQLGNLYDVREFYNLIIGSGSMPLPILESLVDNYIADTLASQ